MPQPCRTSLVHTTRTPEAQGSSLSFRGGTHGALTACATVHGVLVSLCHCALATQVDGSRPVILTGALLPVLEAAVQWVEDVALCGVSRSPVSHAATQCAQAACLTGLRSHGRTPTYARGRPPPSNPSPSPNPNPTLALALSLTLA